MTYNKNRVTKKDCHPIFIIKACCARNEESLLATLRLVPKNIHLLKCHIL